MVDIEDSAETRALLERIKAGEAGALDQLLQRDRDLVRRIVSLRLSLGLAARLDASDVVQEAQLQLSQRFDDYLQRRPMPYRTWLRSTVLETLVRLRRQHLESPCGASHWGRTERRSAPRGARLRRRSGSTRGARPRERGRA